MMKKFITYVTATSLLMGSMCTTAYAATFADIDTVTWSGFKPFLEEAAELKLMNGYDENGKKYCKPRNNVTYCEAAQLMYSIMKVYTKQDVNDATVTKWKPVISAYNIDDWAFKSISYGLENGILTTADLNKFSGNKAANREDVGVIFGKAIDTISGYDTKSDAALSYNDKAQVSASAVPYLELLYRSNLMVGDTNNNFNPKAYISRAEMAVLSVKTYKKLAEANGSVATTQSTAAAGTITNSVIMANGDLFITLNTSTGSTLSLFGTKGVVTPKYEGKEISFSNVGVGDIAKVTYTGTTMSALEITYSQKGISSSDKDDDKETSVETYELVDITKSKVTVKDGSKEKQYRLDDKADIRIVDKKASVSDLQDALDDDYCFDVTLELDDEDYVLELKAFLNDDNPLEGVVVDVSSDTVTIEADTMEYEYPLAEDVEVEYDGKKMRFSDFEDEYEDNEYEVELKLDKEYNVTTIKIGAMEDEYNGTLTKITSKKVTFKAGGKTYEYDFADDVEVEVDGKSSTVSKLKDSFDEDEIAYSVEVDLNRDDEVTELIATSKNAEDSEGTLEEIDSKEVTIKKGSKKYTYDLSDDVDVTLNGKNRDVEDLEELYKDCELEVILKFDKNDEVVEIEATLEEIEEGELRNIVDEDYITVRVAGISFDLDLASSVDVTLDGDDISLDELNDEIDDVGGGAVIRVKLEYNGSGKVTKIKANWEDTSGELTKVDADDDEITVKIDGKSKTYEVARKVDITFKLANSVDEDEYDDIDDYDEDLEGLEDFLDDCDDAKDDCIVTLTLNSDKEVTYIKATAE